MGGGGGGKAPQTVAAPAVVSPETVYEDKTAPAVQTEGMTDAQKAAEERKKKAALAAKAGGTLFGGGDELGTANTASGSLLGA